MSRSLPGQQPAAQTASPSHHPRGAPTPPHPSTSRPAEAARGGARPGLAAVSPPSREAGQVDHGGAAAISQGRAGRGGARKPDPPNRCRSAVSGRRRVTDAGLTSGSGAMEKVSRPKGRDHHGEQSGVSAAQRGCDPSLPRVPPGTQLRSGPHDHGGKARQGIAQDATDGSMPSLTVRSSLPHTQLPAGEGTTAVGIKYLSHQGAGALGQWLSTKRLSPRFHLQPKGSRANP